MFLGNACSCLAVIDWITPLYVFFVSQIVATALLCTFASSPSSSLPFYFYFYFYLFSGEKSSKFFHFPWRSIGKTLSTEAFKNRRIDVGKIDLRIILLFPQQVIGMRNSNLLRNFTFDLKTTFPAHKIVLELSLTPIATSQVCAGIEFWFSRFSWTQVK